MNLVELDTALRKLRLSGMAVVGEAERPLWARRTERGSGGASTADNGASVTQRQ